MTRRIRTTVAVLAGAVMALAATELSALLRKPELMGTRIVRAEELRTIQGQEGEMTLYFQAPTSTLLNLGLRRMTMEPGSTPHPARPHAQPIETLLVVESGAIEVRLGEASAQPERLEAGSALFLAPHQWHELRTAGSEPATFLEMAWSSPGMNGEPDYPENIINWRRGPGRP